jgi:hypothetical protein
MSSPEIKVEIGFDVTPGSPLGFTLDSPTKGLLDGGFYRLGGPTFFDLTASLRSLTTRRGRSQALDRTDAGIASITLDNNDRQFDPFYENGVFYGFLVPRKIIRVFANDQFVFYGFLDDLDLDYPSQRESTTQISSSDSFSVLSNVELEENFPDSELSGARINWVLDLPEVGWGDNRLIDTGKSIMLDNDITEGTNALDYMKLVSQSEFGNLFISKDGTIVFQEREAPLSVKNVIFTDNPVPTSGVTKVPFRRIGAIYGSETLYNKIAITNADPIFPEEVLVEDADSINLYGPRSYALSGLLNQELADLTELANLLLNNYKDPIYRYESVVVNLDSISKQDQDALFDLEIGDVIVVDFTPNNIPPAIKLPCKIIGISQNWAIDNKEITFSLETLPAGLFILDSPLLGLLDSDRLGGD